MRRIGVGQLSLKQWMHRQKVLSLYQRVLARTCQIIFLFLEINVKEI